MMLKTQTFLPIVTLSKSLNLVYVQTREQRLEEGGAVDEEVVSLPVCPLDGKVKNLP